MELQMRAGILFVILCFINEGITERTQDMMYDVIMGASCYRRLNGTHQTGCSSGQFGSVGVLHLIEVQTDLEYLLQHPVSPPYAPILPPHLFTRKNLLQLKYAAPNISVVLLISRTNKMEQFSHELNCPNQYSGILLPNTLETATCNAKNESESWNPWGTGLLHEDFPFPIYYLREEKEINKLIDCYEKFNRNNFEGQDQRSLCAIEVKAFMSAAVSSEVCIRRTNFMNNLSPTTYCDPLEGRNVYATLFPRNETRKNNNMESTEKYILVSTRMDTTSMFDGLGVGALDSLMGYATVMTIGHMLAKILPDQNLLTNKNLNILFVIFNGESYDYIGSQRLVYDMENLKFPSRPLNTAPIPLSSIEFMLDIGAMDDITNIKLHSLREFNQASAILKKLRYYASASPFNITFDNDVGIHIPPTSAQSFLRKNNLFPAIILNTKPTNKYYHSIYDDEVNMNFTYANTSRDFTDLMEITEGNKYFSSNSVQIKIRDVASLIAMALFETLTGSTYASSRIANPLLADELLYCFLESANCPLLRAASNPKNLPKLNIPPIRYISVANGPQESSGWTNRLLGYILSQKVNISEGNCTQLPLRWVSGYTGLGECHLSTQNYSQALSPAFLIDGYDWKSGQYSTWTESSWALFSARIFLKPSSMHQTLTLTIGIIVLIISFCLVYIVNRRSDVLFANVISPSPESTTPTAC